MENEVIRIVKQEWRTGISKKTGKEWTGLQITLQGGEKFTVSTVIFLNDTQIQMLGLTKPAKAA